MRARLTLILCASGNGNNINSNNNNGNVFINTGSCNGPNACSVQRVSFCPLSATWHAMLAPRHYCAENAHHQRIHGFSGQFNDSCCMTAAQHAVLHEASVLTAAKAWAGV